MVRRVPLVHRFEHLIGLMYDQVGAFSDHAQLAISDQNRDLQDAIGLGVEPRHLHIHPNDSRHVLRLILSTGQTTSLHRTELGIELVGNSRIHWRPIEDCPRNRRCNQASAS